VQEAHLNVLRLVDSYQPVANNRNKPVYQHDVHPIVTITYNNHIRLVRTPDRRCVCRARARYCLRRHWRQCGLWASCTATRDSCILRGACVLCMVRAKCTQSYHRRRWQLSCRRMPHSAHHPCVLRVCECTRPSARSTRAVYYLYCPWRVCIIERSSDKR
jgi:hypothetical protein